MGASPLFTCTGFSRREIASKSLFLWQLIWIRYTRSWNGWRRPPGLRWSRLELRGGGKSRMLRIFIDKPGGVTHEDCASVSREVSTIFDVEDAMPGGAYTLEVSSPGLDRKLSRAADFERFQGSRVKLTTREPVQRQPAFRGTPGAFCRRPVDAGPDRGAKEVSPEARSEARPDREAGNRIGQRGKSQSGAGDLEAVAVAVSRALSRMH